MKMMRIPHKEIECPKCHEKILTHVFKENARYHVLSWSSKGRHCNIDECEFNHRCKIK
jgi:hypothetical protein